MHNSLRHIENQLKCVDRTSCSHLRSNCNYVVIIVSIYCCRAESRFIISSSDISWEIFSSLSILKNQIAQSSELFLFLLQLAQVTLIGSWLLEEVIISGRNSHHIIVDGGNTLQNGKNQVFHIKLFNHFFLYRLVLWYHSQNQVLLVILLEKLNKYCDPFVVSALCSLMEVHRCDAFIIPFSVLYQRNDPKHNQEAITSFVENYDISTIL